MFFIIRCNSAIKTLKNVGSNKTKLKNVNIKTFSKVTVYLINIKRERNQTRMVGKRSKKKKNRKGKEGREGGMKRNKRKNKRSITVYNNVPNSKHVLQLLRQTMILRTLIYDLFFNSCLDSKINIYKLYDLKKFID